LELDDIKEIKAIIDLMKKNDLSVFEIEKDGFRLKLQKGPANQTTMPVAPIVVSTPKSPATSAEAAITTGKSADAAPMKGCFRPWSGILPRRTPDEIAG
jgi:acetyl-CoA carboxylase biotin carboxyl carrier protein